MLQRLKNKGIGFYLELIAAVLAIVTAILGMTQNALTTNTNFTPVMDILLFVGALAAIAGFFVDFDFWPLIPAICFSVVFGLTVNGGANVIADWFNKVVYSGGNLTCVISYLIMLGAASILSIVACYLNPKKE